MRKLLGIAVLLAVSGMSLLFAEGGEGGVEAALVTYSDAKAGFSIGHPGTWSQDTSFGTGVKFVGGDDSMMVVIAKLPDGLDIKGFATKDVAAVASNFQGFKQLSLKTSKDIKGAFVLGFTADGKSAVTGKAYNAHNEVYYIPLKGNRVGIVTVTGPENHYDMEGVRDIALTLVVKK